MGCCESTPAPPPKNRSAPIRRGNDSSGAVTTVEQKEEIPLPKVGVCSVLMKPSPPGLFSSLHAAVLRELVPPESSQYGSVLILDERSLSLIESAVKITDLTAVGIPLVENINISRQPLPKMPAVYLVQPTVANATLIANDFETNNDKYREAHIYLTDEETPSFMRAIGHSTVLKRKLRSMKMVRLDFICTSHQSYILQKPVTERPDEVLPTGLQRFFGANTTSMEVAINARKVAEGILNVLGCLGDRPTVRYQGGSHAAELVAGEAVRGMERILGKGDASRGASGTLLIVDRSLDAITPLLHQFTYESMLQDLRPTRDGLVVQEKWRGVLQAEQSRGRATVFDATYDWEAVRHEHVDVLRERLGKELQNTMEKSEAVKLHPETRAVEAKKMNVEEFGSAVRNLPQFQKKMRFLNLHMELLIALLKEMEDQRIVSFAEAEQNFTTGESVSTKTGEVKKLSRKNAYKQLCDILADKQAKGNGKANGFATSATPHLRETAFRNKLRAVLVFAISMGGLSYQEREAVRKSLKEAYPTEKDFEVWLDGLEQLRINTTSEETPWYKRGRKQKVKMDKVDGDEAYLLSRTVPRLQSVAAAIATDALPKEEFPVMQLGGAPGIQAAVPEPAKQQNRRRAPSWASAAGGITDGPDLSNVKGPRIHIFVIGGVTPAEIQACATLQMETKREVVIGGTELLTPEAYLKALPGLSTSPYQ